MDAGGLFYALSKILCVGLLVLTGVLPDVHRASAQTQESCPLPAGVTAPPIPRVTAQQVEEGSASLKDFALAVRDQLSQGTIATAEEALYLGCLIRREGGPYRSGSTYLVQLKPDRIFMHAKTMELSGRLLDPSVYGAILRALGIFPADLANPATVLAAFADAAAGNGGTFNVPDVPGASGYATVYLGPNLGLPIVLLAGFDINASHLAQEDIDHGNPPVRARDVVARKAL